MKLILENWRKFQLNEIFGSPVPSHEIIQQNRSGLSDDEIIWKFKVDDYDYEVSLLDESPYVSDKTRPDVIPYLESYEFSFKVGGRGIGDPYKATNLGFRSGMKVMSTVVSILEKWINKNDFFLIEVNVDPNQTARIKMYNRILKTLQKNLGSDYETTAQDGDFAIINIGFIERGIDKFVQKGEDRTARQLVSAVLRHLGSKSIKGRSEERVLNKFKDLEAKRGINE